MLPVKLWTLTKRELRLLAEIVSLSEAHRIMKARRARQIQRDMKLSHAQEIAYHYYRGEWQE